MVEHPIDTYKKVFGDYKNAEKRLQDLADMIHNVASGLLKPNSLYLSGFGTRSNVTSSGVTVHVKGWPTGQELVNALEEYQRTHSIAKAAWGALTGTQRNEVQRFDG